jgi:CRISPR-associated exonuclease Cas4
LDAAIPGGALFYGQTRRRLDVTFDAILRREVEEAARQVHVLIESGKTPKPVYEKHCESCSIVGECLPKSMQKKRSVKQYLEHMTEEP